MSSNPGKLSPAGDRSPYLARPSGDREQDRAEAVGEADPPEGRPPAAAPAAGTRLARIGDRSERYGGVEVMRYEKDDGRSLLLYSHQAEQSS